MKKTVAVFLTIFVFAMGQPLCAQEQLLVFHYPLYYFSPDKTTNMQNVRDLAKTVEGKVATRFAAVPSKQKATAKVEGVTHLGAVDADSLTALFEEKYPAVIIAENGTAKKILELSHEIKKAPLVLVLLNVQANEDLMIPQDTPRVINIFGLENAAAYQLPMEGNKERFFNIAIKGKKKVDLFQDRKLLNFVNDLLSTALMDAIGSGKFNYGADQN